MFYRVALEATKRSYVHHECYERYWVQYSMCASAERICPLGCIQVFASVARSGGERKVSSSKQVGTQVGKQMCIGIYIGYIYIWLHMVTYIHIYNII